jgi:5-(carboxyamino)imidazole ribonucleotide mutase
MSTARVAILMGSDSDLPVMSETARVLRQLEIDFRLEVTSAHRSPARTSGIVHDCEAAGVQVFVAGAGGAAHLAGVIAAHTTRPVLGVPLAATDLDGLDSLLSTVQMPAGIPVGTLAIGKAGAANAGWLAAAILALSDRALAERLRERRAGMEQQVAAKSAPCSRSSGDQVLERLGHRELDHGLGRDVHRVARQRIAADPRLAVLHLELAEPLERYFSPTLDRPLDDGRHGLEEPLGVSLVHRGLDGQRVDEFRPCHASPPSLELWRRGSITIPLKKSTGLC